MKKSQYRKRTTKRNNMICWIFLITAFILSLNGFSQFDSKLLIGKWKLISGKNADTSIIYQSNDQYYVQFLAMGRLDKHIKEMRNGLKASGLKAHIMI